MSLTSTDEDDDDPSRPLIASKAPAPVTDISYGTIDEDPPIAPQLPSMVRTPAMGAVANPRAPTPTEEALHAAYTEHPIVGSYGAVKCLAPSSNAASAARREDYDHI